MRFSSCSFSPQRMAFFVATLILSVASCGQGGEEKGSLQEERGAGPASIVRDRDFLSSFVTGKDNYVRALAFEGDILWVGTSSGVLKVDRRTENLLATYTKKDGLKNNYVFAIGVGPDGTKWFGTNAGGATRLDRKGRWKTFVPMHGLADFWVYAFAFEGKRTVWIGTWAGVNSYEDRMFGEEFTLCHVKDGLINEWCYGIAIDRQGAKWFATEGGVSRFDGANWKSWTHEDGLGARNSKDLSQSGNIALGTINRHDLSIDDGEERTTYNPNYVFSVAIDDNDVKWFGTWGGGVSSFDGQTWKNYTTEDGLADNIVYAIAIDRKGVMWFGTHRGASRFDGQTWRNYTTENGLIGNDVYAIAVDVDQDKWFGQKGGVTRLIEANRP